jgi:hypothetical protein
VTASDDTGDGGSGPSGERGWAERGEPFSLGAAFEQGIPTSGPFKVSGTGSSPPQNGALGRVGYGDSLSIPVGRLTKTCRPFDSPPKIGL